MADFSIWGTVTQSGSGIFSATVAALPLSPAALPSYQPLPALNAETFQSETEAEATARQLAMEMHRQLESAGHRVLSVDISGWTNRVAIPARDDIDLGDSYEVRYWCAKLGCSERQLRAAVEAVGTQADDVRRMLLGP